MAKMGSEVSPATPDSHNLLKLWVMTEDELKLLADMVSANIIRASQESLTTKAVLTTQEAIKYMGASQSYIYKLMMRRQIPHYKPMGKLCYFKREELEDWLTNNRVATIDEIQQKANNYCMKGGSHGRRN